MARRFELLDGLRGFGAVFVIAAHTPPYIHLRWAPAASILVDIFFVLSGFVIAHAYEEKLRTGMSTVEFMARRLIRLWPMYAAGLALGLVAGLAMGWGGFAVQAALFGLPMIPMLGHPDGQPPMIYPLNHPAWSLFYELLANLLFAIIAARLSNLVLGLLMAAGLAMLAAYGNIDAGAFDHEWLGALGRVLFGFFAGVAVYRLWSRHPSPKVPSLFCAAGLVAIIVSPWPWPTLILGAPALVYLAASAEPRGWMRSLCLRLGLASYGAYILHIPILRLYDMAIPADGGRKVLILTVATAFALALALDRWFDAPVRRWLQGLAVPRLARRGPSPREAGSGNFDAARFS